MLDFQLGESLRELAEKNPARVLWIDEPRGQVWNAMLAAQVLDRELRLLRRKRQESSLLWEAAQEDLGPVVALLREIAWLELGGVYVPVSQVWPLAERLERHALATELVEKNAVSPAPTAPGLLLFTTGTTVSPKPVLLPRRLYAHQLTGLVDRLSLGEGDHSPHVLPLTHIMGRLQAFLPVVGAGAVTFLASAEELARALAGEVFSYGIGVPLLWARLQQSRLGGSVRLLVSGGAPLLAELQTVYAQRGVPLLNAYGMTEAGGAIAMQSAGELSESSAAESGVGRLFPQVAAEVRSGGELWVQSPSAFTEDFFATGDGGRFEGENLVLEGRCQAGLVLANGYKVYPEKLEDRLRQTLKVAEAVVIEAGEGRLAALLIVDSPEKREQLRAEYAKRLSELNAHCPPHERIVSVEVTVRSEEEKNVRTSGMKRERRGLLHTYAALIARLASNEAPKGRRQ